ncbi:MAG: L,D-transpeptidase family protein [Dorea sp.]|nr:L,D-transpeptidase family protein [Dorea sp.]
MKRNDKGRKRDTDDIEFIEIDLDEGFTNSSYEYFANEKELIDEEDYEEEDEEDSGDDDSSAREADSPEGDSAQKESAEKEPVNVSESEEAEEDPSAGDFEDNDEKRAHRRKKRGKSARKAAAVSLISFLVLLGGGYLGGVYYFEDHLFFHTTINGMDFSSKSVGDVEEYMHSQVRDYTLTIEESDGETQQVSGSSIALEYVPGDELKKLVEGQNKFLWVKSLWEKTEIEAPIGVTYNEEALAGELDRLPCLQKENQVKSVNAHPEFKDTEFVIIPEVVGTRIDREVFDEAVAAAISGFSDTLKLEETECYIKPKYLKDSEKVVAAKNKMNSYLGANVTYDFNPYTEVVDASVISQWVKVNKKMKVTFNKDAVKKYIASLAEKYDTINKTREFTTANGNNVSVVPGTYGWEMDQETEYEKLLSDIKKEKTVTREPAYFSKAAVHETMDMGNTYAEVDLSAQHMWLFQNGKVTLESDVVTGNPNIGNRETPSGVYSILELQRNATLVGEKDPKTGKPEYRTPVAFWMRVTWSGIGFHDATWQPYFGGSLYLTNGSHGCINMPYDKAEALFGLLEIGMPVVIHY